MSKHTPGPWFVREPDNGIYDTDDEIANVVARGPYGLNTLAEDVELADARLIAAAPDLLETLRDIVAVYAHVINRGPRESALLTRARAAIAKATGA